MRRCKNGEFLDYFFPIPSNFSNNLLGVYNRGEKIAFLRGRSWNSLQGVPRKGFQPYPYPTPTPSKNIFSKFLASKKEIKPKKVLRIPPPLLCALNMISY